MIPDLDGYEMCKRLKNDAQTQVAKTLVNSVQRPEDLVARFGGEEFVALLPETNLEGPEKIGQQFLQAIRQLQIDPCCSDVIEYITISVGIAAMIPKEYDSKAYLLDRADKMLYKAKHNGRNQFVIDIDE